VLVQLIPRDLSTKVKEKMREANQSTLTRMLRTLPKSTLSYEELASRFIKL
jgi:hypothetical protein